MNYIKQLNAFHLKIDLEPISIHARVLWYTLTDINNRLIWREEFTVAMSKLRDKAGLSESMFKRARRELVVNGFIKVKTRGGNQSALYQMVCLYNEVSRKVDYIEDVYEEEREQNKSRQNGKIAGQSDRNAGQNEKIDGTEESAGTDAFQKKQEVTDNLTHKLDHNLDRNLAPLIKHKQKHKRNKKNNTTTAAGNALAFFQNNIGGEVSPFLKNDIIVQVTDLKGDKGDRFLVPSIFSISCFFRMILGTLKAWVKKGITTVEAAQQEEAAYRNQRKSRPFSASGKPRYAEIVPDWFKEQKRKKELKRDQDKTVLEQRDHAA